MPGPFQIREEHLDSKEELVRLLNKAIREAYDSNGITEETPSSATAAGPKGKLARDDDYFYLWTDKNTVMRAAIATW
jgi:hypothetical protein